MKASSQAAKSNIYVVVGWGLDVMSLNLQEKKNP